MRFFIMFFIVVISVSMAETKQQLTTQEMIQAINKASNDDRYLLMNAFKKHLREMNAQQRKEAIMTLQKTMALSKESLNNDQNSADTHHQVQLQESQKQLQLQHQIQNQFQGDAAGSSMMKKP